MAKVAVNSESQLYGHFVLQLNRASDEFQLQIFKSEPFLIASRCAV